MRFVLLFWAGFLRFCLFWVFGWELAVVLSSVLDFLWGNVFFFSIVWSFVEVGFGWLRGIGFFKGRRVVLF